MSHSIDTLEGRRMLAAFATLSSTGVLTVNGTSGNDIILFVTNTAGKLKVVENTHSLTFSPSAVKSIKVFAGAGDDIIDDGVGRGMYCDCGSGNDRASGSGTGSDTLLGGLGNDTLEGVGGNDSISGGDGNDFIQGGSGNDTVYGGTGNDQIEGNEGADRLFGQNGNDTIYGGLGSDSVSGGNGDDVLLTYASENKVDTVNGGAGHDISYGNKQDVRAGVEQVINVFA